MHAYDVIIIGAGPGGIFSAYELMKMRPDLKVAVYEAGYPLSKRKCPIDGNKVKSCIRCKTCAIMNGFGGAGAFSDGKYNITNDFGGTLYEHIGRQKALDLMRYVDKINVSHGGAGTQMYSTAGSSFKKLCMQNKLTLLDASVRHLGTDINYVVLQNLYDEMKEHISFFFETPVKSVLPVDGGFRVVYEDGEAYAKKCIISVGRSGSKWMESVCEALEIPTSSNRVDIGVRVEIPAVIFSHLTDQLYESKIVYRTEKFEDSVRTFCMNPNGIVVNENTNGIVTVNGHSFEDPGKKTANTNFALLVSKHFSEPFKDSNGYGESIARLSNMLGGGVIVQRFGDLDARRDAGRPEPRAAEADPGRHHRDDLRARQDRARHGQRRHAALWRGSEVLQHGSEAGRESGVTLPGPLYHRRRERRDAFAVARFGERRLCREKNRGRGARLSFKRTGSRAGSPPEI